ncbi:pyrroline-5-carboxylate reductase [Floccifex sp.]|uniref:pyrroline-5-carboxylate reductase n=1 Tax=Floccifex sp. TaxID=2815810 RepID=UPI002A7502AD|nr:pyrroline-5-carboxylate reductase [Floccifex sp.]MDY2958559.1 pyrroline-5-carboxylate reductase [Floccifex sp.]
MKIGFIGCGNMGSAMIKGIVQGKVCPPSQIYVADHHQSNFEKIASLNVHTTLDNIEVSKEVDVLFLSVKPYVYENVISQIKDSVKENAIIVCIAAGKTIAQVQTYFQKPIKIVKAMPNTPAMVQEAMSAISYNEYLTQEEVDTILNIFNSFGKVEIVSESQMDAVTAVSGSSPAYVYMMIEAMADASVKQGMPRKQAYVFASQAVLGAAKMVLETQQHPGTLKDAVCSPSGTTIEAVSKLEETGFRSSIIQAMDACFEKSKKMTG